MFPSRLFFVSTILLSSCADVVAPSVVDQVRLPDQGVMTMQDMQPQIVDMAMPEVTDECGEERCDGFDNDCDQKVDEGLFCSCSDDASCYGGPPTTRSQGLCTDGMRMCDPSGEAWLTCEGWVGPVDEVCDDLDNDCDGVVDEGTQNECSVCGVPPEEVCDGIDNDCDGQVDEGDLLNACGMCGELPEEVCDGVDNDCDGQIDEGGLLNACGMCGPPPEEDCDGVDNDCDGNIDEGAFNACGECGDPPEEVCDLIDDDCDGQVDEGACLTLDLDLDGDCLRVSCPDEAPHPIACDIEFEGNDPRGCVAHRSGSSSVYLQEGNDCGAGRVVGTITCSPLQGMGLNESNCRINKRETSYPNNRNGCADTD